MFLTITQKNIYFYLLLLFRHFVYFYFICCQLNVLSFNYKLFPFQLNIQNRYFYHLLLGNSNIRNIAVQWVCSFKHLFFTTTNNDKRYFQALAIFVNKKICNIGIPLENERISIIYRLNTMKGVSARIQRTFWCSKRDT